MTAIGSSNKYSVGNAVDFLLSAAFTVYWGRNALIGLSKVSCVASRGINAALKAIYFDTSKKDSIAHWTASFIPERISNFFKDDSGYNDIEVKDVPVQAREADGSLKYDDVAKKKPTMTTERRPVYKHETITLLVSGLGLSVVSLLALELKEALWRETNPVLNGILSRISPFQLVLGKSWVADGINTAVGYVKTKI